MKLLLTGDWHFTNNPKDSYKFNIFNILKSLHYDNVFDELIFLGDLTNEKDRHQAALIKKIVDGLKTLNDQAIPITMIFGNHDYVDYNTPFFSFLYHLDMVNYIYEPRVITYYNPRTTVAFIPHTKNPEDFNVKADICCTHMTINGCIAESGSILESTFNNDFFDSRFKLTFSGDIHKPQTIGNFHYVGAPYHNRYGDKYIGQFIVFDTETSQISTISLDEFFPKKLVISTDSYLEALEENTTDFIKIKLFINDKNISYWSDIKAKYEALGFIVDNIIETSQLENFDEKASVKFLTPLNLFEEYVKSNNVPELMVNTGREILKDQIG
jgi:DNA repair exonuclease SbcCD nuclease subunit